MKFRKRLDFETTTRPAEFFYRKKLFPFRRLSSQPINIEGILYHWWMFNYDKKGRYFVAAFPTESADHVLLFETNQGFYVEYYKGEKKLSDFNSLYL